MKSSKTKFNKNIIKKKLKISMKSSKTKIIKKNKKYKRIRERHTLLNKK
jgi:hypothetical protein